MELIEREDGLARVRDASVLVPTMGALHAGHRALIRRAASERQHGAAKSVVVSVFVNPAQFDERGDYDSYPRDVAADVELAKQWGADAVFAPPVELVYPGGEAGSEMARPIDLPAVVLDRGLEDEHRPGHFEGVYRVCRRLFELVRPVSAVFGEKDWQQLRLVAEMSEREGLGVRVISEPTVRETGDLEGLALSSRNVHLTPSDTPAARGLVAAIRAAQAAGTDGGSPQEAQSAARASLDASGALTDYAAVRDAATCGEVRTGEPARVLVAARVGRTRLIDNDTWP